MPEPEDVPRATGAPRLLPGGFLLGGKVGEGDGTEVFRAREESTGRAVAVKLLTREERLPLLRAEAEALAGIESPHVVRLVTANLAGRPPFLVFEPVVEKTLASRLASGPLPEREALAILSGVLAGLADAHARGLVHGDLKPSNVLIAEDGAPLLTDFGGGSRGEGGLRHSVDLDAAGARRGAATPDYMAPEVAAGEPPGEAADLYAAAVLLFEMTTGELPAPGDRPSARGKGASAALDRIFAAGFTRKERRAASAREMRLLVEAARSGRPASFDRVSGRVDERAYREEVARGEASYAAAKAEARASFEAAVAGTPASGEEEEGFQSGTIGRALIDAVRLVRHRLGPACPEIVLDVAAPAAGSRLAAQRASSRAVARLVERFARVPDAESARAACLSIQVEAAKREGHEAAVRFTMEPAALATPFAEVAAETLAEPLAQGLARIEVAPGDRSNVVVAFVPTG